jgi:hypothetical protein
MFSSNESGAFFAYLRHLRIKMLRQNAPVWRNLMTHIGSGSSGLGEG